MTTRNRRKKQQKKASRKKAAATSRNLYENRYFFDRDMSLLNFNDRVLQQAQDETKPLLERVRFLSIFHSNIDEFFMKRIGMPRNSALFGTKGHKQDRMTIIRKRAEELFTAANDCYLNSIRPGLDKEKIFLLKWQDLTKYEKERMREVFEKKIFPVLTPLAVDPAHPFPHISNLSTSLAVALRTPRHSELSFLRVKIPKIFPAWFALNPEKRKKEQELRFVSLNELIRYNLDRLFPEMKIVSTMLFRVTRNIDLEHEEDNYDDFVKMVEDELKQRRFGEVVKLEVQSEVDDWLLEKLMGELELSRNDVYIIQDEVDYTNLNAIANLNIPHLKYSNWSPVAPISLLEDSANIFNVIGQRDVLVHHPYEHFGESVERFIHSAADDPNVRAIKMTLYRTHEKSSIVSSLIRAAEQEKEVVCLIELKARFDEERNINWANRMEDAGVHVVYGIQGLKIHSKLALVVRQEKDNVKSYLHVGTGNYHSQTAKMYTDMGLFTSHPEIVSETVDLFNFLTGHSRKRDYKHLLVAPINMKKRFLELIHKEILNQKSGKPAHIIVKCNGLEDSDMIRKLYEASRAGVKIDLIIRGICTLKPQVSGLSENIRVISVVDRFLEHSRVFYFRNACEKPEEGLVFMGSADWMYRNLEARVEAICPIYESSLRSEVYNFLQIMLKNDWQTWELNSDGSYKRLSNASTGLESSQNQLMGIMLSREKSQRGARH